MIRPNICLLTDSYKVSHYLQYPPGSRRVYSYFESRTGSVHPQTVFFGLQYWLKQYLAGPVVTRAGIDEADELCREHFGQPVFNRAGWEYILHAHGGRLPVEIRAVPEGTVVDSSNVLMTVENTDDRVYWLTNYLETLLVQTWYPSTVATQSRAMKQVIARALVRSGDVSQLGFKLHDFGFRGVTCPEQAGLGGLAHLTSFLGTDTLAALQFGRHYYHALMAGFSIPAAEHSTITSWGRAGEVAACRNMLRQYPTGLVAVVSDSYDIFHCCAEIWGGVLKAEVLARDGTLVIRPDSGDPPMTVVRVLEILGDKFGSTTNGRGYRVLPPQVRVIQGDGIDFMMLGKILDAVLEAGWSADNVAFGSGGGLLQKLNRDTQRFAFKCSSILVGNEERDVYKQPVTDSGKISKKGRLKLVRSTTDPESPLITVPATDPRPDELYPVFRNGHLLSDVTFEQVRSRCALEE
ncbi:MAG: nicotinate phosphoribosyltransferase [Planctomycetaceae bacterium]|jgi:nicotinamide phosphoribosyltransferase